MSFSFSGRVQLSKCAKNFTLPNCGTTEFVPGYTLRMRRGRVLIEGCCAKCGAEVARLCD